MKTKEELKLYFENGDKPTQEQFWEWMDSYLHKDEIIERIIPIITDGIIAGHSLSLSISKDAKKIRQGAFQFNSISYQIHEVIFNEGLEEIGIGAFQSQNIKKIKTPSTLKIIENGTFAHQGETVFGIKSSLEEIILNEGLEIIGDFAFYCPRATVQNLYLPSSLKSLGQDAFAIPSLKTVSAPKGLDLRNAGIPETAIITYR